MLNFLSSKKVLIDYVTLTIGLGIGLLGLFVETQRENVLPMLSLIFGIVLIVEGISDLLNAFI